MSHNYLANYYNLIFNMVHHHKYSMSELENSYPFERDMYAQMVIDFNKSVEEAKNRAKQVDFDIG